MQMAGSFLTIGWSVVSGQWSVEKTDDVADGRGVRASYCALRGACRKLDAFGRVLRVADGKGAKSVQKGTENSKLGAHKCAYLRISARKCGFGEKLGQVLPDGHYVCQKRPVITDNTG